jgi:hypothetical protein
MKRLMYSEEIILNVTFIENMTLYVISGFKKETASTIHTITTVSDVDIAVFNMTYLYAVPKEGTTTNAL